MYKSLIKKIVDAGKLTPLAEIDWEKPYNHYTFHVNKLEEFLRIIDLINQYIEHPCSIQNTQYYRGHEKKGWDIRPGIARNSLLNYESLMINDFIRYCPDEFEKCNNNFDLLAKIQHYGLPTRLLDFTSNPLIALYFACISTDKTSEGEDGRVICCTTEFGEDSITLANLICSMHEYPFVYSNTHNQKIWEDKGIEFEEYIHRVYSLDFTGVFRQPSYISQREVNQKAHFLIYPNNMKYNRSLVSNDVGMELYSDFRNNDDSRIYDCIFDKTLKGIEENVMKEYYYSIIINGANKNDILNSLSIIGITNDFIFPELEYTAKRIKKQYIDYESAYDNYYR